MLKLSNFDYLLPRELIAQYPLKRRDSCRLMVVRRKEETIEHVFFGDILKFFKKDDLLILNDTKVLPCRLVGKRKTGGKVEIFLLNRKDGLKFNALFRPGRLKINETIIFDNSPISAKIICRNEVAFNTEDLDLIYGLGRMPLPPYIKRDAEESDNIDYQTVYAKEAGAVASPTAGLHFTSELLERIKSSQVNVGYITLHVGLGTFKPVKSLDITTHKMEPEYFKVPQETVLAIEKAKKAKSRLIAVGTTSLRSLEAYAGGIDEGKTNIFIYPGYKFKLAGHLLTNFHLPKTTLFMLVSAFAGADLIKKAYQEAIDRKYRFYSYGDAMLII